MTFKHEWENRQMSTLTETLRSNLNNPVSSPEFDLYTSLDKVLSGVGLSAADSGGKITFYGKDPIVPSCLRFGEMSAIGLDRQSEQHLPSGDLEVGKDKIFMSMSARRCGGLHLSSSANGRWLMVIKLHLHPIRKILSFNIPV